MVNKSLSARKKFNFAISTASLSLKDETKGDFADTIAAIVRTGSIHPIMTAYKINFPMRGLIGRVAR